MYFKLKSGAAALAFLLLFASSLSAWPTGQPTSQLGAQGAQLGAFVLGAIPAPTGPSTGFPGSFRFGLGLGIR